MNTFQHLATFTYPSDLFVARSLLESMDIECLEKDEMTVQVHNFYSNALGGIKLEVPTEKYDAGKNLLVERGFEHYLVDYQPVFSENDAVEIKEFPEKFNLINALKKSVRVVVIAFVVMLVLVLVLLINF